MPDWCYLEVREILKVTEKAFLVMLEDGNEVWIPHSQLSDSDAFEVGDVNIEMKVTSWWASQEELL